MEKENIFPNDFLNNVKFTKVCDIKELIKVYLSPDSVNCDSSAPSLKLISSTNSPEELTATLLDKDLWGSVPQNDPNNNLLCTSINNTTEVPFESNNDIHMTEVSAKADVEVKAKEIRKVKNNRASQKLREKKKEEEQAVVEREKEMSQRYSELKRRTELLQQEKRTMLWSLKQHVEVLLNSSKEEIQKYLLHYATITDKYGEDNDLNDILGEITYILKEAIDGHQNPCLIAGVIDELAMEQRAV